MLLWSCGRDAARHPAHPEWSYNTVVYELNVRQLTPEHSFAAAEAYLPALKDMGVDIVWVMPPYPIGEKGRKGTLGSYYAISNYCDINPEFGTMTDFESFLAEAHRLGLRVILDWVANHTSPDALWIEGKPAEWYVRDENGEPVVQYDWTDIAKLNYDCEDMREAMLESMLFWVNKGVDGFRCDVAGEIPIDFWRHAFAELRKVNPDLYLLAEGEKPELHIEAFDASYAWELHHLLNDIAQGEKGAADLKEYIARDAVDTPHEAFRLMFTSNHDENSWNGTEFERMGDAVKCMAALTFVLPNGQPLIYTGQEVGYDHRFEFFEADPLPSLEPNEYTEFYKWLCAVRHAHPALESGERGGKFEYVEGVPENTLAFTRTKGDDSVLCMFNLSDEAVNFTAMGDNTEFSLNPWGYMILSVK
ncbi:MAG: alpha-amylase [Alistipes sp.]|nr:alpha-amylase [Alistipes sp.]